MSADRAVVLSAVAGLLIVTGIEIGEARARQQIATICPDQPGAQLASTVRDASGLTCIYVDHVKGRAMRKVRL